MSALLDGLEPEALVTVGGLMFVLILITFLAVYVIIVKRKLIPEKTHLEQMKDRDAQVKAAILDRDSKIAEARKERDDQIAVIRGEMTERMENFRADHLLRMKQSSEDHEKQLAALLVVSDGIRADRDTMLAAVRRDSDDWRGAYHILSDNAKASEDRMDEVLETERLILEFMRAIRSSVFPSTPHPLQQLNPGEPQ